MDHGDPRLEAVIANCEAGLKRLLKTAAAEVFFYIANGHGAWEETTENLLAPGEAALIPSTGHFSEQWAPQLEATGRRAGVKIVVRALEQPMRETRKILEHVIAKYPGHHLAQEARNYLKGMPQPA